eukprot:TRINITY_DN6213_c0_g1_i1.p1 TRINITY_DN6213_c0_g1~~TRINITY_DN6213_c0_g1_i1.p1  ORF type:complete len:517 (-),score=183.77 TRINITY_DN6213_c0_g1_i1:30-1580(-)
MDFSAAVFSQGASSLEDDFMPTQEMFSSTQPQAPFTPSKRNNPHQPWGRLVSLTSQANHIDLVKEDPLVMGRSPACDVTYIDQRISGMHCKVFRQPDSSSPQQLENRLPPPQASAPPPPRNGNKPRNNNSTNSSNNNSNNNSNSSSNSNSNSNNNNGNTTTTRRNNSTMSDLTALLSNTYIEDMSVNGTYINGKKLGKGNRTLLKHGDKVSFIWEKEKFAVEFMFQEMTGDGDDEDMADEGMQEVHKNYDIRDQIGSGSFSVVKLGVHKRTGKKVAVKIIDKKKYWHMAKTREQIQREVEILRKVQHPNVISIIDIFDTGRHLFLILELATGGELFDKIVDKGFFPEEEARVVFRQLLGAIQYLHSNGIAHRDLKPENILLDSSKGGVNIKVTDFGLARVIGEKEMMKSLCGSPMYCAPEIIRHSHVHFGNPNLDPHLNPVGYDKSVDMWSVGVIIYVLLSGCPPFDEGEMGGGTAFLFDQIEGGQYALDDELWNDVSASAKDLVRKLMCIDPSRA